MTHHVTTRWGAMEDEPTLERMRQVLNQLDSEDKEHCSVSLTHDSEWNLGAYPGGLLVWENLEADNPPRHMNDVSGEQVLALWIQLSKGNLAYIEEQPWLPGYED